jgi:hypothetical protein
MVVVESVWLLGQSHARIEKGYPMSGETLAVIWRWMLER